MDRQRQTCKTGEPCGTPVLELYAVKAVIAYFSLTDPGSFPASTRD